MRRCPFPNGHAKRKAEAHLGEGRCEQPFPENDNRGFTLIEVIVALAVLAIVLLAADRGAVESLSATAVAQEHSVASGLVTSTMAQAVALPFSDLKSGLNPSVDSLSSDSNVLASGTTNCSASPATSGYVLELNGSITPSSTSTIPVCNTNTSEAPLVPHVSTVKEGITYTVHTYPTMSTSAPGLVTVVVVVTWKSPTGGIQRVVGEDAIAAP
jgi:prepilin-type N-terminal cleavage/methylation domain-containing protein